MEIQTKLCNRANYGGVRTSKIEYIVIHYTANLGDTAKNNADYFAREIVKASAHYFVDEHYVWQSVPDDRIAWHCGGGLQGSGGHTYYGKCKNANSLGVEICMQDKQGKIRLASIDLAAQLVRVLMAKYGVPADRVIRHFDVTGKMCPAPMVSDPALWQKFKNSLEVKPVASSNTPASWAKDAWEKATKDGVVDGTRPTEPVTRQELAVILDRLGLVK